MMGLKTSAEIVLCAAIIAHSAEPSALDVRKEFCNNKYVAQVQVIGINVSNDKYAYVESPTRKNRLEYRVVVRNIIKGSLGDTISVFSGIFPYRNSKVSLGRYLPRPVFILDSLTLFLTKDDAASKETRKDIYVANYFFFNEDLNWTDGINNCDSIGTVRPKREYKNAITVDSLLKKSR
jgi:hypothetical protein